MLSGVPGKRLTQKIKGEQTALPALTIECSFPHVPRCCLGVHYAAVFYR